MRLAGVEWDGDGASIDAVPRGGPSRSAALVLAFVLLVGAVVLLLPSPLASTPADPCMLGCDPPELGPAGQAGAAYAAARGAHLVAEVVEHHRLASTAAALRRVRPDDGVLSPDERQVIAVLTHLPAGPRWQRVEANLSADPVHAYVKLAELSAARGHTLPEPFHPDTLEGTVQDLVDAEWSMLQRLIPDLAAAHEATVRERAARNHRLRASAGLAWRNTGPVRWLGAALLVALAAGAGVVVSRKNRAVRLQVGSTHLAIDGQRFPWEAVAGIVVDERALRIRDYEGGEVVFKQPALREPGPVTALLVAADRFRAQRALGRAPSPEVQAGLASLSQTARRQTDLCE